MSVTKFKIYLAESPNLYLTSPNGGVGQVELLDNISPTSDSQLWNVDDLGNSNIAISTLVNEYLYNDGENVFVQTSPNPIPWLKNDLGSDEVEIVNTNDPGNLLYLCRGEEGGPDDKKAKAKPQEPPYKNFVIKSNPR